MLQEAQSALEGGAASSWMAGEHMPGPVPRWVPGDRLPQFGGRQPTNPVDEPGARKHPPKVIQPLHSPRQLRALDPEVTWLSSGHLGRRMSWDHCSISSPFFAVHTLSLPAKRQLGGPHCRDSLPPPLALTQPPVLRSSLPCVPEIAVAYTPRHAHYCPSSISETESYA